MGLIFNFLPIDIAKSFIQKLGDACDLTFNEVSVYCIAAVCRLNQPYL